MRGPVDLLPQPPTLDTHYHVPTSETLSQDTTSVISDSTIHTRARLHYKFMKQIYDWLRIKSSPLRFSRLL